MEEGVCDKHRTCLRRPVFPVGQTCVSYMKIKAAVLTYIYNVRKYIYSKFLILFIYFAFKIFQESPARVNDILYLLNGVLTLK